MPEYFVVITNINRIHRNFAMWKIKVIEIAAIGCRVINVRIFRSGRFLIFLTGIATKTVTLSKDC